MPHDIDPATFPTISVEQDVADWNHEIAGPVARQLVLDLVENLELENQALLRSRRHDPRPPSTTATGSTRCRRGSRTAEATGVTVIERYQIDDVNVTLLVPFGKQDGLSLGLESRGTVDRGDLRRRRPSSEARTSSPFATTFALRQVTGGRWLNVGVLPPGTEE